MKDNIEKSIKRWLKRKVTITLGVMVAFMIAGGIIYSNDGVINQEVTIKWENGKIVVTPEGAGVLERNTWTNGGEIEVTEGNGVKIDSSVTEDKNFNLINNGLISASGTTFSSSNGIDNSNRGTIENLINSGVLSGDNKGPGTWSGNGVNNYDDGKIEKLTNSGLIIGNNRSSGEKSGNGVYNSNILTTLVNNGVISGNNSGSGMYSGNGVYNNSAKITTLIKNNGVVAVVFSP